MTSTARYRVDPETLRDVVRNADQLASWLDTQLTAPVPADPEAERRHRTEVGVRARMLRRLDVAEAQLSRALDLAVAHGTPQQAVLARVRHAHVLQWQDRFDEANAAFERCLTELDAAGDRAHFVHQHAGKCAFDFGDWSTAAAHFAEALRAREALGDPELIESSRLAVEATDACATAAAVGAELHRLVAGGHAALRPGGAAIVAPAQPGAYILVNCCDLLLPGPAPLPAVRAIHRYFADQLDGALADLAVRGWLSMEPETITATPRCRELLASLLAHMDGVFSGLWGSPDDLLRTGGELIVAGRGSSQGDAFDALAEAFTAGTAGRAGEAGETSTAGRLFAALCALRHHRGDAHAAAWQAYGLTVDGVRALDEGDPRRRRIEAATDQVAARPYRSLTATARADLVRALRALPV